MKRRDAETLRGAAVSNALLLGGFGLLSALLLLLHAEGMDWRNPGGQR